MRERRKDTINYFTIIFKEWLFLSALSCLVIPSVMWRHVVGFVVFNLSKCKGFVLKDPADDIIHFSSLRWRQYFFFFEKPTKTNSTTQLKISEYFNPQRERQIFQKFLHTTYSDVFFPKFKAAYFILGVYFSGYQKEWLLVKQ